MASPSEPPAYPEMTGSPAEWLRALDWRQFEDLVARAYRFQGYEVLPTAFGADGGIDLILARGTERIFVQCKHWRSQQVGVKVIRELYGVVAAHGATWGIVATSGTFSIEAEEFARTARITLLDGRAVAQLVALGRDAGPAEGPALSVPSPVPEPQNLHLDPSCPICSSPMSLRTARRGPSAGSRFWGCTRFPGCKGVRPAPNGLVRPGHTKRHTKLPQRRRIAVAALVGIPVAAVLGLGGVALAVNTITSAVSSLGAPAANPSVGTAIFGGRPTDVAYDSTAKVIYTANAASGDITVADATTLTPTKTINVAGKPAAVAVDSARHLLYVADGAAKKVYVIDTRNGRTISTLATRAKPSDLAVDPARQRLFVVSKAGNSLEAFNTATRSRVGSRAVPGHPNAITVDPASHQLYIAGASITVRSGITLNPVQTLPLAGDVDGLAVDAAKQRVYLTRHTAVEEYTLSTNKTRRVAVVSNAGGIAVDPASHRAYLAVPEQNAAVAINVK